MSTDLCIMPPRAPMEMPAQDFQAEFRDRDAPGASPVRGVWLWRLLAFGPALVATLGLTWVILGWFSDQGINIVEGILLTLIAFNFFWIAFTVSTVLLGLVSLGRRQRRNRPVRIEPLKVALLMPIYNEEPWYVLGNARSMLEELRARGGIHSYDMFILSDTQDDDIAAKERDSVRTLQASLSPGLTLYYRRRPRNTDRKVGNIAEWVSGWGAAYPAMLVLDADSLMTGRAIIRLTDALARDPGAGLIQSFPHLIGAQTMFARMQQFANGVYGEALAEGVSRWCGQEGNYWGHNAIIRTAAFASCAGLPHLRTTGGREQLIMSHDFVEAGLLRRAGWGVRFLPRIRGSYEETPQTLIDHILRDRRWCQGNLQHLKLLRSRGFRSISRFHMFHGAVGYLMSPIWFALLVMWALIGVGEDASVLTYFNASNPLIPTWPEVSDSRHVLIIVLMYAMLLAPKLMAILAIPLTGARFGEFGGGWRFALSFLSEVLLAVLYAPILMVQQMVAVFRVMFGLQKGWTPQARAGGHYGVATLMKCHAIETISGTALTAGILAGLVSPWLLPIAISLLFAVPLSALSGMAMPRHAQGWMGTRETYREPLITQAARHYRAQLKSALEPEMVRAPAE
jgi:membrane glycosyltransferase